MGKAGTAADPRAGGLVGSVRARLGSRALVPAAEVAAACNVSADTVREWIEEGLVEAANVGVGERPRWQVYGPSVVAFYEERLGSGAR